MSDHSDHLRTNDLAGQLTDRVDSVVDLIRDRSTRPLLAFVRSLIIGTMVGLVALLAVLIAGVALITLFNHDVFGQRVWATDFLFGGMLVAVGVFLLRKSGLKRAG